MKNLTEISAKTRKQSKSKHNQTIAMLGNAKTATQNKAHQHAMNSTAQHKLEILKYKTIKPNCRETIQSRIKRTQILL
ncbi:MULTISPECIES: hypothetical protein [Rhizobium/Agrobacterium group]|uniref:hypothetical protein n=1 Tax=Rhizobium/Agrobacterium group TaxID=227290 RepID=UPI003AA93F7E